MTTIPFVPRIDDAPYATIEQLTPIIQRVIANNPSKFTYRGTGTYILGTDDVVVIDPGPRLESHQNALDAALRGRRVVGIAVTHCHADHSPLAAWMKSAFDCPTFAIGPHADVVDDEPDDGDDDEGDDDESDKDVGHDGTTNTEEEPRETIDREFVPDLAVADGQQFLATSEFSLVAVATPGHTSNHMCVAMPEERALFTGDHVMGWSTTVVSPPDGDMRAYMASLRKVRDRNDRILWPTHGGPVAHPRHFLDAYIAHRLDRERQIVALLSERPQTIRQLVATMYVNVAKELHKPARRSVWSHLIMLCQDGVVRTSNGEPPRRSSIYELVG